MTIPFYSEGFVWSKESGPSAITNLGISYDIRAAVRALMELAAAVEARMYRFPQVLL